MEARASYLAVGILTLALMIGIPATAIWLGKPAGHGQVAHFVRFTSSVAGLDVGGDVTFGGIPIGHVTGVTVDSNTPTLARVDILVEADVPIYTDSKATLASKSLFGGLVIDISRTAGNHGRRLNPGEEIPPRYSPFGKLSVSMPALVAAADRLFNLAHPVFTDDNIAALKHILANFGRLRDQYATYAPRFGSLFADASDAFSQLRLTWTEFKEVDGPEIDRFIDNAKTAQAEFMNIGATFTATSTMLSSFIQENRRSIEDFASTGLPQVSPAVNEVNRLVKNLKRLWTAATQDPARFFLTDRAEGFEPSARVNNRR